MAIPDPDQANELFAEAVKRAKQKQAKYVQEDEQELIAQMKAWWERSCSYRKTFWKLLSSKRFGTQFVLLPN
jgi:hypothetical protein